MGDRSKASGIFSDAGPLSSVEDTLSQIGRRAAGGKVAVLSRGEKNAKVVVATEKVTTTRSKGVHGKGDAPVEALGDDLLAAQPGWVDGASSSPCPTTSSQEDDLPQAINEDDAEYLRGTLDRISTIDSEIIRLEREHHDRMRSVWNDRRDTERLMTMAIEMLRKRMGLSSEHVFDQDEMGFVLPKGR